MSVFLGRDAVAGYVWMRGSVERSGGPERVITNAEPDPNFKRRPIGFAPSEPDPLTWEGDQS